MTRGPKETVLAPVDRALLSELRRAPTLVEACRRLGISHDRGVYRLRRLARAVGRPVSVARKGGPGHGTTRLTAVGEAILREEAGTLLGATRGRRSDDLGAVFQGRYRSGSPPRVEIPGGPVLAVAFEATNGETVSVRVDPESVLVATERLATSARNVLGGTVRRIDRPPRASGSGRVLLRVSVGAADVAVAVTESAVTALRLRRGRRVYLYVKATALQPRAVAAATPGSLPR